MNEQVGLSEQMVTIHLSLLLFIISYALGATITLIHMMIELSNRDDAYRNQIVKYFRGAK